MNVILIAGATTTIMDFLWTVLGTGETSYEFIYYIIGGSILLITIDAILNFIFGGISNITMRK